MVRGMLKDKVTGSGMSYIDAELSMMFGYETFPARWFAEKKPRLIQA